VSQQPAITAQDWLEKALQERLAAQTLANAALWAQAFCHAGFAIECALKHLIMRRHGWNAWPDRARVREIYTHDLIFLAQEAGIAAQLDRELEQRSEVAVAWLIVKDWKNDLRYDPLPFPELRARDMVAALDERGLLAWLIKR